jgi:hypothetical protein
MPHPEIMARHVNVGRAHETEDENHGPYLLRVIWPLAALSTFFLGLRLYCKLSRRHRLFWDDYFLLASWVTYNPTLVLRTGVPF